jgi:hypothetical protein
VICGTGDKTKMELSQADLNQELKRILLIHLDEENERRLLDEGHSKFDDDFPAVNVISTFPVTNSDNTQLVNFLCSWKEYLRLASINFRKAGNKCGICTAYTTWLGQKDYIPAVANSPVAINSMTDLLKIGHRTGKFSAFIVALKFGWPITPSEQKMLCKERGSLHFDIYLDFLEKQNEQNEQNDLWIMTILRHLLLSRSHLP